MNWQAYLIDGSAERLRIHSENLPHVQNKVTELEAKVEEQNGRISALVSDKAAMDSRIGILNRVLRMREEHIELLQRRVRVCTQQNVVPVVLCWCFLCNDCCACARSTSSCCRAGAHIRFLCKLPHQYHMRCDLRVKQLLQQVGQSRPASMLPGDTQQASLSESLLLCRMQMRPVAAPPPPWRLWMSS